MVKKKISSPEDKDRVNRARSRARAAGMIATLTLAEWEQTVLDFRGLCAYCQSQRYEVLEHFIPVEKAGTHLGNCIPACTSCNLLKSNSTGATLNEIFGQEAIDRIQRYLISRSSFVEGTPLQDYVVSPFDAIRQYEQGQEFWSARELQGLLGYAKWERFDETIERAMVACQNSGHNPSDHFPDAGKLQNRGNRGGTQEVKDYRLTRYACYLVAMNGDPRKPEIAAAQTYFAVKTREAEVAQEQVNQSQQPQTQPSQGWDPNFPVDDVVLEYYIQLEHANLRREQAKLRHMQEEQAYRNLCKLPIHLMKPSVSEKPLKLLPSPKKKTFEELQTAILKHLAKRPLTVSQLHTRYLKSDSVEQVQEALHGLIQQKLVEEFSTPHAKEGKYRMLEQRDDIS